jgi:hypothetical protein
MSSIEVELAELKKSRRLDEKRIRAKIVDEYDSLVRELAKEIFVVQSRFRENQMSSFNEIMGIMSESQTSQIEILIQNTDLPEQMRMAATTALKHENQVQELLQQNFDLKMTVQKIRALFLMKEHAIKAFFDSKVKKLSEANKENEDRLWDSYRDSEAREIVFRKQIAKLQKQKNSLEIQIETVQKQLKEELQNTEVQTLKPKDTAQSKKRKQGETAKSKYDVDVLIRELNNKTALVEELLQERIDVNKNALKKATSTPKATSLRNAISRAAEPETSQDSEEIIEMLIAENKTLRRKLFLNGIQLPPQSQKFINHTHKRKPTSRGSQPETLYAASGMNTPARSRPITAPSPIPNEPTLPNLTPKTKQVVFATHETPLSSTNSNRPQTAPLSLKGESKK